MGRTIKWLLFMLSGMVVLLLAAGLILYTFDWNHAKPRLNTLVSDASGRHFAIAGDLSVDWTRDPSAASGWQRWVPLPIIEARDVTLGNPEWAEHEHMARVGVLRFGIELPALLQRTIVLRDLALQQAQVALERADATRNSWTFERPAPDDNAPPKPPWRLTVSELELSEGELAYRDRPRALSLDAKVATLADAAASANPDLPYGMTVEFTGKYREADIQGTGKTGAVLSLREADTRFPLQLDVQAGKVQASAEGLIGGLRSHLELDLDVHLQAPSMAMLYPLTGIVLPNTAAFETNGKLTGALTPDQPVWRYQDFHGRVGKSDIQGSLTYEGGGERPSLSGQMRSKLLQFADLGPLIGVGGESADPAAKDPQSRAGSSRSNRDPTKVLPDQSFKTDRWRTMDVDIEFTGQRIVRDGALPLQNLRTHVYLENGILRLDPFIFGVADGTLEGTIALDGSVAPMRARLNARANGVQLPSLFPTVQAMQRSTGRIDGAVALVGRGNSIAALLGDAGGEIKLYLRSGRISRFLLEAASLNIASAIVAKMFGDSEVRIQCAGVSMALKDGLGTFRDFRIATDSTLIDVTGAVDFQEERLALDIEPQSNEIRILSLRTPLYVNGSFRDPDIGLEKGPLLLRAAAALGLVAAAPAAAALLPLTVPGADQEADCDELLRAARQRPTTTPDTGSPIDDKTQPQSPTQRNPEPAAEQGVRDGNATTFGNPAAGPTSTLRAH